MKFIDQFSEALKERIGDSNLTKVAAESGMSFDALYRLSGKDNPTLTRLSEQLDQLGMEVTITVTKKAD